MTSGFESGGMMHLGRREETEVDQVIVEGKSVDRSQSSLEEVRSKECLYSRIRASLSVRRIYMVLRKIYFESQCYITRGCAIAVSWPETDISQ